MDFEIKTIGKQIIVVVFVRQYDLCMSFLRMQEFYENPKFKGTYFTLEEYVDWEFSMYGIFNYPFKCNGFNLPGSVFNKWKEVFSEALCQKDILEMEKEKKLKSSIEDVISGLSKSDFYIIGIHKEKGEEFIKETLDHEIAHALYFLCPKYKRKCNKLLKNISKKSYNNMKNKLIK
jgi:hypothetical protein